MNKAYRLVWSVAKNLWVVAAELVSGNGGPPPVEAARRSTYDQPDSATRSLPLSSFIMALEPRFMFDAAGAATAALVDRPHADVSTPDRNADQASHHYSLFGDNSGRALDTGKHYGSSAVLDALAYHRLQGDRPGQERDQQASGVLFVDSRVEEIQSLIAGVKPGIEIVFLDAQQDGVSQISSYLQSHTNISSIYIFSHGSTGSVAIGTTTLDAITITDRSAEIGAWSASLTANADILLYGCDVAAGSVGSTFIGSLAQVTGADVAASIDPTGAVAKGGNWVLEASTGVVEARSPLTGKAMAGYEGLLAAPVNIVPSARTVSEDNTITFSGATVISVADADDGNLTTTLSVDHGSLKLFQTTGLTFNSGADSSASMQITGTIANINAALNGLVYRPTANFSGVDTLTLATNDGTTTDTDSVGITVTANATAPVLTLPTTSQAVAEDTPTYLDFAGSNAITLTDADTNDLQTLTLSVAHGTITIKTDVEGGITSATTNGTGSVILSGTAAQLSATLANSQGVSYISSLNYNSSAGLGVETLSFALSDGVVAHNQSGTVAMNVTQANDAPTFTGPVAATVLEGGSVNFSRAQLASSDIALDVDIQTGQQVINQLMVKIESLPAGGSLSYKGGAVVVGSVVPVTDLGSLAFTHDGTDIAGNLTITFNVTVSDGGGGATAGIISVTVQPKNIAPTMSGSPTLIEGQVKVVSPAINLGDGFDTLANSTIVIDNVVTGGQGTLFIDANNNNIVDAGETLSGTVTLDATQRANLSTQLKFFQNGYEPNTPAAVSPSYRITVTDAGGGTGIPSAATSETITLSILPNNDDPTLSNTHATVGTAQPVNEGSVVAITTAMLQISDTDLNPANTAQTTPTNQLVYTIGTRATQGEIQVNIGGGLGYAGDGWITLGDGGRFTQAQVDAGQVRYYQTVNVADAPTTTNDNFTFTVRDSAYGYDVWTDPANPTSNREGGLRATPTGAITSQQFYLNITPLAAPTTPRVNIYEGGPRDATSGFGGSNMTYTFAPTSAGMFSNNSTALGTWVEANVGASGYTINSDMLSYTITRTDTVTHISVTVPSAETVYTLTSQPPNGTVQSNVSGSWLAIPVNGQFTQADIDAGKIRFVHDGGEDHSASFGYNVSDGTPNHYSNTFGLDITPTNDRPTGSGGSVQVLEQSPGNDGLVRLGSSVVGMSDVDNSLDGKGGEGLQDFLWFMVIAQPKDGGDVQHGELQRWDGTNWVTVAPGQWLPSTLLTMDVAGSASGLRYAHDASEPLAYTGGPNVTFQYQVRDDLANPGDPLATSAAAVIDSSGSAQSNLSATATATATIRIIPVNNAPQIADIPGVADPTITGTITDGGALTGVNNPLLIAYEGGDAVITSAMLTGIDPDNTTVQRQYIIKTAPTQGILMLDGKLLGVGSTFTQKNIDDGLVTYRHNGSEVGDPTIDASLGTYHDKFHFVLSDAISDDTGTGTPNYNTFLITLTPTNDAPTVTGPSGIILIDSATAANNLVSGFSVADSDLANGVQSGETDFVQATVRILDSAGTAVTNYTTGFASGGVSIGYTAQVGGLWAVTQSGSNNILQIQGTRAQVNAALAGLSVTFANDNLNSMYKVQVIADDRMRNAAGALTTAASDSNGGELNQGATAGAAPTAVPGTVYDWATAVAVPAADSNISAAMVDIRASRVNEPVTFTGPGAQTVYEDVRTRIPGTFNVADPESAAFNTPVTVTVSVPGGQGTLGIGAAGAATSLTPSGGQAVNISGDNSATITLTGRAADIKALLNGRNFADGADDANGGLYYTSPNNGNHDYNGVSDGDVTLTLALADTGSRFGDDVGAGSVANNPANIVIPITITPINDVPTVSAGSTPVAISGTTAVTGFGIADDDSIDGGPLNATPGESDFMQATVRLLPSSGTAPLDATAHGEVVFSSSSAGTATVDATYTGNGKALVIRGTLAEVNTYLSGLQVALSGSLLNNNTTYRVQVIADDRMRDGAGVLDGSNAANGGLNTGATNVPATAVDPYAAVPSLTNNVASSTRTILGSNVNEVPVFTGLDATPTFAENGAAIVLDANATVADPELSSYNNWGNAVLTLGRQGGINAEDQFSASGGTLGTLTQGANLVLNATTIGTVTTNSGGQLVLTFNDGTTTAQVNSVLQQIKYYNGNNNPPLTVVIDYTINDGDTDPTDRVTNGQGTGGALTGSGSILVGITPVNDIPTLTGLSAKSYTEDATAVVIGSGATPGDFELASFVGGTGNWGNASLTISRNGGANAEDSYSASGTLSALTEGSTLTDGAVTIGTVTTNSAGTLKITFAEDVTTAQAQAAIRQIAYSNSRQALAAAATSTVTLSWLLEDGDTDGDRATNPQGTGGNQSVTVAQTITLTGVNDAPLLADTVLTVSQVEDAAAPSGAVGVLVSTLIGGQSDVDSVFLQGIAITAADSTLGDWYYSTNSGTSWTSLPVVADNTALLLRSAATDRLYFKPVANLNGTVTAGLTIRAWDQKTGTAGNTVDTSGANSGAATAFSAATDTVQLTVTPVNDAPTRTDATAVTLLAVNEDVSGGTGVTPPGDTVFNLFNPKFSDANDQITGGSSANTLAGIAITTDGEAAGTHGRWQYSTDHNTWTNLPAVSTASALLLKNTDYLRFVPSANYNGTPGTLTARLIDTSGAAITSGTTADVSDDVTKSGATTRFSNSVNTVVLNTGITAVNDTPLANADTSTAIEAGGLNNATVGSNATGNVLTNDTDVDISGETKTVTATGTTVGTYGTLTLNADGSYTYVVDENNAVIQALRVTGQTVAETFNYTMRDTAGLTSNSTLTVTVDGRNDTPTANTDSATAVEKGGLNNANVGSNATGNVLNNDTDLDVAGETKTVTTTGSTVGTYGTLTLNADGSYTYVVNENNAAVQALRLTGQTVAETFNYTMHDTGGLTSSSTLTVTVDGRNDTPIANTDIATAIEAGGLNNATTGIPATGNVLTNDSDVDAGDTKTVATTGTTPGTYGTLTLNADGSYSYVVDESNAAVQALRVSGQTVSEVFTYTMVDAAGATSASTLTVTIDGRNDTPAAVADTVTVTESATLTKNAVAGVLTNDADVDAGDSKTVTQVVQGGTTRAVSGGTPGVIASSYGTLTLNSDGSYTYVADGADSSAIMAGQTATDTFTYTMKDAAGLTSTTTLAITITGKNNAPLLASASTITTNEDTTSSAQTLSALVTVSDVDTASSLVGLAIVGNTATAAQGIWQYSADGSHWAAVGTTGDGANALVLSPAAQVRFVPDTNYHGTPPGLSVRALDNTYSGGFTAFDGTTETRVTVDSASNGGTTAISAATKTIGITVVAVNDAPLITALDATSINAPETRPYVQSTDAPIIIDPDVSFGDQELGTELNNWSGATLTTSRHGGASVDDVFSSSDLTGGVITVNGQNIGSYTNSNGTLVMTFDANATTALVNSAAQSIKYSNSNAAPVYSSVTLDWILNDQNSNASGGTTGSGQDQGLGGLLIDSKSVVISMNRPPVAVADTTDAVEAGGIANATVGVDPTGNVLANDTDPDLAVNANEHLAVTSVTFGATNGTLGQNLAALYGTLKLNADGSYVYAVDNSNSTVQALRTSGDTLTETFNYTMRDAAGLTSSSTLTVTIHGANDNPVATADSASATEAGGAGNATPGVDTVVDAAHGVLANDTDIDNGDSKTVSAVSGTAIGAVGNATPGSYGTLTLNADGSYRYAVDNDNAAVQALNVGATLTEIFTYTVKDTAGDTSTATLNITVHGANDHPVNTLPGEPLVSALQSPLHFGGLHVDDTDSPVVTVTLSVAHGVLQLSDPGSANLTISGSGSSVVTLTGSLVEINALISGNKALAYIPDQSFSGNDPFTMSTNDGNVTITNSTDIRVTQQNAPLEPPVTPPVVIVAPQPTDIGAGAIGGAASGFYQLYSDSEQWQDLRNRLDDDDLFGQMASVMNGLVIIGGGDSAVGRNGLYLVITPSSQESLVNEVASFNLPQGMFRHSDPSAKVKVEAKLADGRPLPDWLSFDPDSGRFTGKPPVGSGGYIDIKVTARDQSGNVVEAQFLFHVTESKSVRPADVDVKSVEDEADKKPLPPSRDPQSPPVSPRLDLRDGAESTSPALKGRASLTEQMAAFNQRSKEPVLFIAIKK